MKLQRKKLLVDRHPLMRIAVNKDKSNRKNKGSYRNKQFLMGIIRNSKESNSKLSRV